MNVDSLARWPGPVRAALYFALQRLIGSEIRSAWRQFLDWTWLTPAEHQHHVEHHLSVLLEHATRCSPYYRKLGLVRNPAEPASAFLRRFPVLTRDTVKLCFADLVIESLQKQIPDPTVASPRRYDWLIVKTGGTTGAPTTVVHDRACRDWGRASRLLSQQLCGFPLGTRYFRLWGSEADLLQQEEKLDRRVLRNLLGEIPMNAFRARAADLEHHYHTIRSHPRIGHLMTYIDAAASLAEFIQDRQLPPPRLDTIMGCAGTVTPEWRRLLQSTFKADVYDKYGSRECADIACECSHHTGLHVYSPAVYVEVVDDHGNPAPPGVTGRILITLLRNFSFPMIRYEIGDLGVWAEETPCPCGLPFPRLASIEGRQDDRLITEDGTKLSSVFIRHFVGVSLNRQLIRQWQFEQVSRGEFIFRFIPQRQDGLAENLTQLQASFRTALGPTARVQMRAVDEIPLSATGKYRWIINRQT